MKIRSDFVSNSSSSSFIVKAESDTPEIFAGQEKYGFSKYAVHDLRRDVFECFDMACWGWDDYSFDSGGNRRKTMIRDKVRIIPDDDFIKAYTGEGIAEFTLPECCRKYVDAICLHIEKMRDIDAEDRPKLFENGEESQEMLRKWHEDKCRRSEKVKAEFDKIVSVANGDIAKLLKPAMNDWNFYYAELDDADGDEGRGRDAVCKTTWYRVFCNH